jgi:hypothetical protein
MPSLLMDIGMQNPVLQLAFHRILLLAPKPDFFNIPNISRDIKFQKEK